MPPTLLKVMLFAVAPPPVTVMPPLCPFSVFRTQSRQSPPGGPPNPALAAEATVRLETPKIPLNTEGTWRLGSVTRTAFVVGFWVRQDRPLIGANPAWTGAVQAIHSARVTPKFCCAYCWAAVTASA